MASHGATVLPGDAIQTGEGEQIRIGPGLYQAQLAGDETQVVASKAGVLRQRKPNGFWVDSNQRRYVAVTGEIVVGIITSVMGENYAVDIGTHVNANLSVFAFEGATKRNRPNLQSGDLVYARVTLANKDIESQLECVDASGKSSGMGLLKGGTMIECSLGYARRLLKPDCPVLVALGQYLSFETAVGMNGRVWMRAQSPYETVLLANALESAELMTPNQVKRLVKNLVQQASNS